MSGAGSEQTRHRSRTVDFGRSTALATSSTSPRSNLGSGKSASVAAVLTASRPNRSYTIDAGTSAQNTPTQTPSKAAIVDTRQRRALTMTADSSPAITSTSKSPRDAAATGVGGAGGGIGNSLNSSPKKPFVPPLTLSPRSTPSSTPKKSSLKKHYHASEFTTSTTVAAVATTPATSTSTAAASLTTTATTSHHHHTHHNATSIHSSPVATIAGASKSTPSGSPARVSYIAAVSKALNESNSRRLVCFRICFFLNALFDFERCSH